MPSSHALEILEYYMLLCFEKEIDVNNILTSENIEDYLRIKNELIVNGYLSNRKKVSITSEGKKRMSYLSKKHKLKGTKKFIVPLENLRIEKKDLFDIYLK